MKRYCSCLVPACLRTKAPSRGLKISQLKMYQVCRKELPINVHVLIYQVIGLPLGLVALDMGSDGNLLFFMNSYLDTIRAQDTRVLPNNSTNNNFTVQHYNSLIEAGRLEVVGEALFIGSCLIIGFSLLSLILENPAKTLIRSVRTSALMRSKEMNAKDLPVPIGNVVGFQWSLILLFV